MTRLIFLAIAAAVSLASCHKTPQPEPNLRIGIFGGSQSISSYARPVKQKWESMFHAEVTDCGKVGAGYGLWQQNNVPVQIAANKPFDVYIFWCSTNDAGALDIALDDENDPNTQSGGLRRSVEWAKGKNPDALIFLFTSISVPQPWLQARLPHFVDKQIRFCSEHGIPFVDQFRDNVLEPSDFVDDGVHLCSEAGYWKLEPRQTELLAAHLKVVKWK